MIPKDTFEDLHADIYNQFLEITNTISIQDPYVTHCDAMKG